MDLASTIGALGDRGAVMRTGTVKRYDTGSITVDVGGGQLVSMPYLDGYLPVLGDPVQCLNQAGVWFAIGRASQFPSDNTVVDPSFELTALGSPPAAWGVYNDTTQSTIAPTVRTRAVPAGFEIAGSQMLEVACLTAGQIVFADIYSSPIPVVPGQAWTAAAWAYTEYQGASPTLALKLAWFANSINVYPNTVAADSLITFVGSPALQPWMLLRGASGGSGAVVPAGANFMRVVLENEVFEIASALWDKVVCRRVS